MAGRTEALAILTTIAAFVAGVGVGAILNGIAHTAEIIGLHATIDRLRAAADRVGPEPRRPLSSHHLRAPAREAQSHAASADRRGPTT